MALSNLHRDKARMCFDIAEGVADPKIVAVLHKVAAYFHAQADAYESAELGAADAGDAHAPHPERARSSDRKEVSLRATLRRQGETKFTAELADLSETGFRVDSHYAMPVGSQVWLTLPGLTAIAARVAWSGGNSLGCKFETPLHSAVLDRVIEAARRD